MGSCGSSVADRAIGLDGHDAVKEYSIEKAKQDFIENYIKQIYKNTSQSIRQLKQKKLTEIEDDQTDARKIVESVKADIQKREPGSIGKAEALHKKTAEQLLGLNETLHKLQNQKHIVNDRYQQEEKQILREIRDQYQKIFDKINPSTSKLTHINTLPESDRLRALKWGEKYSQKQIAINNKLLKDELDKKFEFAQFAPRFDNIVPSKSLTDILDDCRERANRSSMKGSKCATC